MNCLNYQKIDFLKSAMDVDTILSSICKSNIEEHKSYISLIDTYITVYQNMHVLLIDFDALNKNFKQKSTPIDSINNIYKKTIINERLDGLEQTIQDLKIKSSEFFNNDLNIREHEIKNTKNHLFQPTEIETDDASETSDEASIPINEENQNENKENWSEMAVDALNSNSGKKII